MRVGQGEKRRVFGSGLAAKRLRLFFDGSGELKKRINLIRPIGEKARVGVGFPLFGLLDQRPQGGGLRAGIQARGSDGEDTQDAADFFGFWQAVFKRVESSSGLRGGEEIANICAGGIFTRGAGQVSFGGPIVSELKGSFAGASEGGEIFGAELEGKAVLREGALIIAGLEEKVTDVSAENHVFGQVCGKNDEFRF